MSLSRVTLWSHILFNTTKFCAVTCSHEWHDVLKLVCCVKINLVPPSEFKSRHSRSEKWDCWTYVLMENSNSRETCVMDRWCWCFSSSSVTLNQSKRQSAFSFCVRSSLNFIETQLKTLSLTSLNRHSIF